MSFSPLSNKTENKCALTHKRDLVTTGSEEREVLRAGSIHVAILPSCQDMETIADNAET